MSPTTTAATVADMTAPTAAAKRAAQPAAAQPRSARPSVSLVLAVSVVVALQAAWIRLIPLSWVSGDSRVLYFPTAKNLLRQGRYSVMDGPPYLPTITKMPGYSVFLAALGLTGVDQLGTIQAAQFVLVALTALIIGWVATRCFDRRVGWAAALLVAAYPGLGVQAMQPLSEALTCLLAALHIATLVSLRALPAQCSRRRELATAVAAGASLSALALVRQSFAFLLPIIVLACLLESRHRPWRRRAGRAAAVGLATAALVGPWCLRNIVVSGEFVPFGANSGLSLFASARQYQGEHNERYWPQYLPTIAENLQIIDAEIPPPPGTAPGLDEGVGGGPAREAALDRMLTEQAIDRFASLSTGQILTGMGKHLIVLWSVPPGLAPLANIDAALMLGALAGLVIAARERKAHWPLWVLPVYLSFFHLIFHVEARYSLPARPLLLVFTGLAMIRAFDRLRAQLVRSRPLAGTT